MTENLLSGRTTTEMASRGTGTGILTQERGGVERGEGRDERERERRLWLVLEGVMGVSAFMRRWGSRGGATRGEGDDDEGL